MPALLLVVTLLLPQTAPAPAHAKEFWRGIAKAKFALPAGESAPKLAAELVAALGSPDPELRDDLAFSILTSWIYTQKLLTADDVRGLMPALQAQLRDGVGAGEDDRVLRRSFSALTLSVIAGRENADPFMSGDEFQALVDNALAYFRAERDLRGFDPVKGWIHSAAHTADLLKFLARDSKLRVPDQSRILGALTAKNREAAVPFSQGEDERMARVVISIARRSDFHRDAFGAWLKDAQAIAAFPNPATAEALRAQQNVRHLLSSLWTELSVDERPSEGAEFARTALRAALKTLF